ncbi:hypothetical protein KOW79_014480 [Hemibagrus wyckioides]|uniref:TRAFD1/XAF1 zinc finger domain-containing protein n=1 Tax=Hemibagrus wyckioides TaxID=337641 RepID=A0A9D3SEV6_9TELE|nr:XIAP-associated factor 1 [Hemibagrus wyckioides]KAG7321622.1 hypothetical protein KOW79_014480 [Hemibagrus wyckioides]
MDPKEEMEVCSHCNKEVVKTNLPMHEAHCQRFLCLCPDCEEQVPKDQLEEHRQEQHTLIKCQQCHAKMEKCKLAEHEAHECTERLESCEFCQLALPLSKLDEHVETCGSRTERCQDCNQYVILKDQLRHAQICNTDDFNTKSTNGNVKHLSAPTQQEDEGFDYMVDTSRNQTVGQSDTTFSLSNLQKKKKQNEKTGWIDQDQISTCPYCHLALPVNTLKWHQDKCRIVEGLRKVNEAMDVSGKK